MWLVFLRNWIFNCGFFPPSSLLPLATISLFSVSITLFLFCYVRSFVLILDFYIGEIIPCFSFSVWLISLSIISPRSIYVIANGKISFFFYGWLTVHHKFWNQGACCLQLCFSFSRWFWLSRVFLHTLWLFVLVLWKMLLVFWWRLHWIYILPWYHHHFNNINSSNPRTWSVFPSVSSLVSFISVL